MSLIAKLSPQMRISHKSLHFHIWNLRFEQELEINGNYFHSDHVTKRKIWSCGQRLWHFKAINLEERFVPAFGLFWVKTDMFRMILLLLTWDLEIPSVWVAEMKPGPAFPSAQQSRAGTACLRLRKILHRTQGTLRVLAALLTSGYQSCWADPCITRTTADWRGGNPDFIMAWAPRVAEGWRVGPMATSTLQPSPDPRRVEAVTGSPHSPAPLGGDCGCQQRAATKFLGARWLYVDLRFSRRVHCPPGRGPRPPVPTSAGRPGAGERSQPLPVFGPRTSSPGSVRALGRHRRWYGQPEGIHTESRGKQNSRHHPVLRKRSGSPPPSERGSPRGPRGRGAPLSRARKSMGACAALCLLRAYWACLWAWAAGRKAPRASRSRVPRASRGVSSRPLRPARSPRWRIQPDSAVCALSHIFTGACCRASILISGVETGESEQEQRGMPWQEGHLSSDRLSSGWLRYLHTGTKAPGPGRSP